MTVLNCNVVPINIAETNLCTINLFEKQRPWHTKVLMQDGAFVCCKHIQHWVMCQPVNHKKMSGFFWLNDLIYDD